MGIKELLIEFLASVEEPTRGVLAEVLLAEQRKIDMERPQLKSEIKDIIEASIQAEREGR